MQIDSRIHSGTNYFCKEEKEAMNFLFHFWLRRSFLISSKYFLSQNRLERLKDNSKEIRIKSRINSVFTSQLGLY